MSISATVRQCLMRFKSIEGEYHDIPGLEDEHGRFRTWVGNISAHRSGGRRSLEYRLRDSSNLQSMVVALLEDLLKALDDLDNAVKAETGATSEIPHDISEGEQNHPGGDSDDEDDAALFGLLAEDGYNTDAAARAIAEVHEVNLCLLRFSMTLRNPARHDQMKESTSTSTHHFEPFDIDHVQHRFPKAQPHLHKRLGKAISKHRQYFKYREEHHSKLAEGLDDDKVKDERPSTVATSLNVPALDIPTSKGNELETESVYTATSYAPTTAGDVTIRPPPLPEAGQDGSPFECPICFSIVIAEDERSWRQHVYEDLPPYVCTYASCITANQRYSRRRDWQRHQASSHNRHWLCPYGCSARFDSEHVFQQHLGKQHHIDAQSAQQRLLETCAVAPTDVADLTCPLCQYELSSSKLWTKHVGHHLEQLALHALPQHVFASDSEDENGATGQPARSSESSEIGGELNITLDPEVDNNEGEPTSIVTNKNIGAGQSSALSYACDLPGCTISCKREADLQRHKNDKHGLWDREYQCDSCNFTNVRKDKAREHEEKNSGHSCKAQENSVQLEAPTSPHGPYSMNYPRHQYPPVDPADQNPPCDTLYVGNLPIDTAEDELKAIFSKRRGYKRLVFRTKQNGPMCFVQFEDVSFATKALHDLYGFPLSNSNKGGIRLSFSKNPLGARSGQANSASPHPTINPQEIAPGSGMTWPEGLAREIDSQAPSPRHNDGSDFSADSDVSDDSYSQDPQRAAITVHSADESKPYRCPVVGCDKTYQNHHGLRYHRQHGHENQQLKENPDGTLSIVNLSTGLPSSGIEGNEQAEQDRGKGVTKEAQAIYDSFNRMYAYEQGAAL